jgi:hypothetical protein
MGLTVQPSYKTENTNMKRIMMALAAVAAVFTVAACQREADVASYNLDRAAEMFELERRIVFYNGITGDYMLVIEGTCSMENLGNRLGVTCKTGPNEFRKHFLGLSDNVSYFSEQGASVGVSTYHHRVIFRPQTVLPDWEMRIDGEALRDAAPEINPRE